jgi:hypothetical protein
MAPRGTFYFPAQYNKGYFVQWHHKNRTSAKEGCFLPKQTKLKYHFHNPNTEEATAEMLLKVFMKVNQGKVERAIQDTAEQLPDVKEPLHNFETDCAR